MAITLIVEDGSRPSGANSYITVDYYRTYWEERGEDIDDITDEKIKPSLIMAADYINAMEFKGDYSKSDQPMTWPRANVQDRRGVYYSTNEIPWDIKKAACEIAKTIYDSGNIEDMETNVISESIGPISTSYAGKSHQSDVIKKAIKYIDHLLNDKLRRG